MLFGAERSDVHVCDTRASLSHLTAHTARARGREGERGKEHYYPTLLSPTGKGDMGSSDRPQLPMHVDKVGTLQHEEGSFPQVF